MPEQDHIDGNVGLNETDTVRQDGAVSYFLMQNCKRNVGSKGVPSLSL